MAIFPGLEHLFQPLDYVGRLLATRPAPSWAGDESLGLSLPADPFGSLAGLGLPGWSDLPIITRPLTDEYTPDLRPETFRQARLAAFGPKPAPAGGATFTGDTPYAEMIGRAAAEAGIEPELLAALVWAESGYNPRAVSQAGAQGLTQLMPDTARGLGVTDSFDPWQNLRGGARFLRNNLDRYGGDVDRALAAYNAGPGAVDRYGGIPPFAETRAYVPKVRGYYEQLKRRVNQTGQAAATATAAIGGGSIAGALAAATSVLGTPYVFGGATEKGFDCSGLIQWAYRKAGMALPRTAQGQYDATARVRADQLRPGDLVFYQGTYNAGTPITHVAIYQGSGRVIMAPTGGDRVKVIDLSHPYWSRHLAGYGRVGR